MRREMWQEPLTFLWIAPGYRNQPDSAAFAEYLADHAAVQELDRYGDYPWSADIPPRDQWDEAVATLDASVAD